MTTSADDKLLSDEELLSEDDIEKGEADVYLPNRNHKTYFSQVGWNPGWTKLVSKRGILEALLIVVVVVLLVVLRFATIPTRSYGDTTLLQVSSGPRQFTRNTYYLDEGMFTNTSLMENMLPRFWELSSDGRGFVGVEGGETTFGVPLRLDIADLGRSDSYIVSYFHQIHCIPKITAIYAEARLGIGNGPANDAHMAHCLDVLRQAIMCFADGTLENGEDTWEVVHQCRDYKQVQEWAAERATLNWTKIIGHGHRIDIP